MKPQVFLTFSSKSAVTGVWVDEDAPILSNPNDMKYCAHLLAERRDGVVVINKGREHPNYGRSLRAIIGQDARLKGRWRRSGSQLNYSVSCFPLPVANWYHELMKS